MNRLWTNLRLTKINPSDHNPSCPHCPELDNTQHIFHECRMAKTIWKDLWETADRLRLHLPAPITLRDTILFFPDTINTMTAESRHVAHALHSQALGAIWYNHCKANKGEQINEIHARATFRHSINDYVRMELHRVRVAGPLSTDNPLYQAFQARWCKGPFITMQGDQLHFSL